MNALLRHRWAIGIVLLLAIIVVLHPWRVVRLDAAPTGADGGAESTLDIAWRERLPQAMASAEPLTALDEDQVKFVRGAGRVERIDRSSRVGRMIVNATGVSDVAIQIGPVLRGTALRDALGLGFADFADQVAYAGAARDLNERALAGIELLRGDLEAFVGHEVTFAGAARRDAAGAIEVTPIAVDIAP